ncbi:MAG: hypothetical protein E6I91_07690 [Chloroflexi bacterium]|nr:MAG: hypothetical protein E6I91_07690 [Chloroflexota bacterium]
MDDVVPSALQRLRAADIIRVAGLTVASMGQEYCRIGAVRATMRRGAKLLGIVDTSHLGNVSPPGATGSPEATDQGPLEQHRCSVEVEIQSPGTWHSSCTCSPNAVAICRHAAALLYQWLAHPNTFVTPSSSSSRASSRTAPAKREGSSQATGEQRTAWQSVRQGGQVAYTVKMRGPTPSATLVDILSQNGLSELRGIAREYDIATAGLNKQQLAEAIAGALRQPELVRRSASTLEKPQRQLLATLTLAGGSMSDEDLRSLFERFSFGPADSLQSILLSLQGKGLLFRTSLNSSPQQRIGLSGLLYDVGWYVPAEVQTVLRVSVPTTPFVVEKKADGGNGHGDYVQIQQVETYSLLADLLLVARALDGYRMEHYDERDERSGGMRSTNTLPTLRPPSVGAHDGTISIAPPGGLLPAVALERLQSDVPRIAQFLRFAFRLLRLADLLHKDDEGMPGLRLLPNAARLLLGPTSAEAARDLFELWLTHPGYEELFDLQEEGLRLKCRTTPLNNPILRPGELEAENSEARQLLVALVAQAPLNQWISFSAFARFIYRLNPTFLQKRQRLFPSPHWWLEQEEGRPLQPTQMSDWMRAEGHYLARLLRGPLHWWGISDLALSGDGRLLAFRLTPMAGLLLNGVEPVEQAVEEVREPSRTLDVLETGELLVESHSDSWPLIELIEDFAEVAGVCNGRLCYRLAPRSLAEALGRGQQPGNLLRLLRKIAKDGENSVGPLPCLLAQLERWIASYGRVRLYTGVSMVEVADNLVMRELSATTSVEEQIVKSITPTLMILTKQGMERIVEDLKRRGQSPLLHEEEYHGTK